MPLTLSQAFGYASSACWLGAQLPQIYKNFHRQSCEGLSLIFLLNWYLGDFSNLMGCILLHQLPFQTWLAGYFVCVDTTLLFQYFYYTRAVKSSGPQVISVPHPVIHTDRTPSRYRTISAVAANVAAAAALAAQHDELGHSRRHTHRQRRYTEQSRDLTHEEAQAVQELPSKLMDSFYSEDGHATRQNRVSWSTDRYRARGGSLGRHSLIAPHDTSSAVNPNTVASISTEELTLVDRGQGAMTEVPSGPPAGRRRNSRAGRGGAGLVFLGVWALFGLGGYATGGKHMPAKPNLTRSVGRVLGASITNVTLTAPVEHHDQDMQLQQHTSEINVIFPHKLETGHFHLTGMSNAKLTGRIFAWLCTTLYLTCRLPQIWTNYVRKSVEGLSMSLFICALFANVFYVASVVSSPGFNLPPPLSTEYIQDSIPYLLGSGGTVMFDITILSQFFVYRTRRHGRSFADDGLASEETGLLIGTQQHYYIGDNPSRGRTLVKAMGP